MEIVGLDLHKCESQLSIKADDRTITDRRIATSRKRFTAVFGERASARILLEASMPPSDKSNSTRSGAPNCERSAVPLRRIASTSPLTRSRTMTADFRGNVDT